MTRLDVASSMWARDDVVGPKIVRRLYECVEFLVDDFPIALRWYGQAAPNGLVTLFDVLPAERAMDLMVGRQEPAAGTSSSRVPVLVCPATDQQSGALVTTLSHHKDEVRWSGWSWVNVPASSRRLDWVPPACFNGVHYRDAMEEAFRLSTAHTRVPITEVHLHPPAVGLSVLPSPGPHAQADRMHACLSIKPITPSLQESTGSYREFLRAMSDLQLRLTQSRRAPDRRLSSPLDDEIKCLLTSIRLSAHRASLPEATQVAVEWFADLFLPH